MLYAGSSCKYGKLYFWSLTFLCPVCFNHPHLLFILYSLYTGHSFVRFHQMCIKCDFSSVYQHIHNREHPKMLNILLCLPKYTVAVAAKYCDRIFMCDSNSHFINLSFISPSEIQLPYIMVLMRKARICQADSVFLHLVLIVCNKTLFSTGIR